MTPAPPAPAVEVVGATHEYRTGRHGARGGRAVTALDDVTLTVPAGQTLALVGESGSGKTTLARAVTGLLRLTAGRVAVHGSEVTRPRGDVQMVWQDPYSSLNPRRSVGASIADPLVVRRAGTAAQRRARVAELLTAVGLEPAAAPRRPASFSGGERQRIAIARALAADPSVLVCDEPVSALDVTVRAQVVELLRTLQRDRGLSLLVVTHDFALVERMADHVAVLQSGRLVESGPAGRVLADPRHPYTAQLLAAVPRLDVPAARRPGPAPAPVDGGAS